MKPSRWISLTLILAVVGSFGSCVLAEQRAEKKAKIFCSRFEIGSEFKQAVEAVNAVMDAQKGALEHQGEQTVFVSYAGAPPFSGHTCSIDGVDGKIIRVQYEHID
jgi:hypothetical protein